MRDINLFTNKSGELQALHNFYNTDLYDLTEQQIIETKDAVLQTIKINNLEEKIKGCILYLSNVGNPSFGADATYIALDNQERLNIIYQLLNTFELFKTQTKNLKKNKSKCNTDNYEYVFDYLLRLQELLKQIYKYTEFKFNFYLENNKQIASQTGQLTFKQDNTKFLN